MRATLSLFSSKNGYQRKIGNFAWEKALCAPQGFFVVTDETTPFEWVGSYGAYPCIIMLIHAAHSSRKKVAACAHLSAMQSPLSVEKILLRKAINTVLSVHLVSGFTALHDQQMQDLRRLLQQQGVNTKRISYQNVTQAALNVKTGEITYDPVFTVQNTGKRPHIFSDDPLVQLTIDARNPAHAEKLRRDIATASQEIEKSDCPLSAFSGSVSMLMKI
jgi:hypothetical protein